MSEQTMSLRWLPWPAELGAAVAVAPSGQSYVARARAGGGFALFYGGQHVRDCDTEAECVAAAEDLEAMRGNMKGPTT